MYMYVCLYIYIQIYIYIHKLERFGSLGSHRPTTNPHQIQNSFVICLL